MAEVQEARGSVSSPAWDIHSVKMVDDNSVIDYDYHEYQYSNNNNISTAPIIEVFTTDTKGLFYTPGMKLEVKFKVTTGQSALTVADYSALASNGWLIFDMVKLRFGNNLIGELQYPGKATHVYNLLNFSKDYMTQMGPLAHQYLDEVSDGYSTTKTTVNAPYVGSNNLALAAGHFPTGLYHEKQVYLTQANPAAISGTASEPSIRQNPDFDPAFKDKVDRSVLPQSIMLPLNQPFPILGMYSRVLQGTKISVELTKTSDVARAVFGSLTDLELTILGISLWVPRLKPSLSAMSVFSREVKASPKVTMLYHDLSYFHSDNYDAGAGYKSWIVSNKINKPSSALLFFQGASRDTSQLLNPLEMDLPKSSDGTVVLSNVEIRINGVKMPSYGVYQPSIEKTRIVSDIMKLANKDNKWDSSSCITVENWDQGKSLFAFDFSAVEANAFEATSTAEIEVRWQIANTVSNIPLYNVCMAIKSQGESVFDYTQGVTSVVRLGAI